MLMELAACQRSEPPDGARLLTIHLITVAVAGRVVVDRYTTFKYFLSAINASSSAVPYEKIMLRGFFFSETWHNSDTPTATQLRRSRGRKRERERQVQKQLYIVLLSAQ